MKKVKSIGTKVMSVGLAASVLLAPVGANNYCFAAKEINNEQAQQAEGNKSSGTDLGDLWFAIFTFLIVGTAYYGYNNPETVKKAAEVISGSSEEVWSFAKERAKELKKFFEANKGNFQEILGDLMTAVTSILCVGFYAIESVFKLIRTVGFKNTSAIAVTGYLGKKVYDLGKGAYNKVSGLFKSKKNEQENKDNKGKLQQTGNINVNNVNVNNLNVNNLDEDWLSKNRDKLKKALGMQN